MSDAKSNKKQRVVVICPGRGTYNKEELGYLQHHHSDKTRFIDGIDQYRMTQQQMPIASLDAMAKYQLNTHTAGENASALIYGCAGADFADIDQQQYEIVAVTGNSMGWYIALALSGALNAKNAIKLINTMGSMMSDGVIGGQLIYPIVDEEWQIQPQIKTQVLQLAKEINTDDNHQLYLSIELGGYLVFGGNKLGLKALEQKLPVVQDKYPMNLFNHAAFHTPLLAGVAEQAKAILSPSLFNAPAIPLIDGQGKIWQPLTTDRQALYDYTFGTQVVEPYHFSRAIEVAVKEFAPEKLIVLGPGSTLGGSVAQCLIAHQWLGLTNKADFIRQQKTEPYLLAMGLAEQRKQVVK